MILPIRAFGDPVLRKKCHAINPDYPGLDELIANMFETMYESNGVGLAAPQIGKDIRLFIIDTDAFNEKKKPGIKRIFINAEMIVQKGTEWEFEEGCLSIPKIRENVKRPPSIRIKFQNERFEHIEEEFNGIEARVIQHEYDHIEGILFVDYLSALKKQLLKGKLQNISKGKIETDYKMKFFIKK